MGLLVLVNKSSMQCRPVVARKVAFIRSSVTPFGSASKMAVVYCAHARDETSADDIPEAGAVSSMRFTIVLVA